MKEPSERPLNMLLLLSSNQLPEPEDEVLEIEDAYSGQEEVPFAVSRFPVNLTRAVSLITFYGDEKLDHRLLAQGTFRRFVSFESKEARELIKTSQVYDYATLPETFRGFALLANYKLMGEESVDSLDGLLSDDQALTKEYLYSRETIDDVEIGKRKNCLYYLRGTKQRLSNQERLQLLRSEVASLQDKCNQLGRKYRNKSNLAGRLAKEKEAKKDAESPIKRSPREKILSRMEALTKEAFSNLEFDGNSLEVLTTYCSHTDGTWEFLRRLNVETGMPAGYEVKKFEGNQGVIEIKLTDPQRIYFKREWNHKARVLVSLKKWQLVDEQRLKTW